MYTRRESLKKLLATGLGCTLFAGLPKQTWSATTPDYLSQTDAIEASVQKAQPLLGGSLPPDFRNRLGATHYAGKYCLTEKPFLLEGCQALHDFGLGTCKLWFENSLPGYGFHSDWSTLDPKGRLIDIARHPYFREAFEFPFSTFVLEITELRGPNKNLFDPNNSFEEEENQFEELTAYLYETYADRNVTFLLQQWEGDWLFRQSYAEGWTLEPQEAKDRAEIFRKWFAARQNGVLKARQRVGQGKKCRVLFAVEVNRVLDLHRGIPTLTSHVLLNMEVDLVSWSAYDGMGSVVDLWRGIETIRHYMKPTAFFGKPIVYIGEIGNPENERKDINLTKWWDERMGVFLAQDIPWIVHWELYCNEITEEAKQKPVPTNGIYTADDIRGFWLIRPDGSLGHAAEYFKKLLERMHIDSRFRMKDQPGVTDDSA